MTRATYDVIIVGSGPAGASTALHLLQDNPDWHDRLLVLEKEHFPREKLCAGGITPYGLKILSALGLSIDVPYVDVREARLQFEDLVIGVQDEPIFRVTRRAEFDAWLAACARERGTQINEGEPVVAIKTNADGVTVSTNKAQYRARVLVGADGSKGVVRNQVGLARDKRVSRLLEVITPEDAAVTPEFREQFATFEFSPMHEQLQGYYWDFPSLVGGEPYMNRGLFDARIAQQRPRAPLKPILAASMQARDRDLAAVELKGNPLRWFGLRGPFSRPHVLLVGDAAGVDPLFGEGIAFALRYGQLAAQEINAAFSHQDFSFRGYRRRIWLDPICRAMLLRRVAAAILYQDLGGKLWRTVWRMVAPFAAPLAFPHKIKRIVRYRAPAVRVPERPS